MTRFVLGPETLTRISGYSSQRDSLGSHRVSRTRAHVRCLTTSRRSRPSAPRSEAREASERTRPVYVLDLERGVPRSFLGNWAGSRSWTRSEDRSGLVHDRPCTRSGACPSNFRYGGLIEDVPERRSLSVSGPVLSVFQLRASTFRLRPGWRRSKALRGREFYQVRHMIAVLVLSLFNKYYRERGFTPSLAPTVPICETTWGKPHDQGST